MKIKKMKKQKRENRKKRNNGQKCKCFIANDESYHRQDYMTSTQSKSIGERPHDILQNSAEYSYHHG